MKTLCLAVAALSLACSANPPAAAPEAPVDVAPVEETPTEPTVALTTPAPPAEARGEMDMLELDRILRTSASDVRGGGGQWEFTHLGVQVYCLADPAADRMRLFAPIVDEKEVTPEQRARVLEANFHTALDARYATTKGVLFSAFLHPLSSLTEGDLKSAVDQVATLARTFGTHYASSNLEFAPTR